MKMYQSDTPDSVQATPRASKHIIIPVFNFRGSLVASESDKWYPPASFMFTAGYATATSAGTTSVVLQVWKNTYHRQIDGTIVVDKVLLADSVLPANGVKSLFNSRTSLNNAKVSPSDYITVKAMTSSGHGGVVVQIFGDRTA